MSGGTGLLGRVVMVVWAIVAALAIAPATASADTDAMPNRDAIMGTPIVVWGNTTQAAGSAYTIDFGDMSPVENGNVVERSYIATTHTYAAAGTYTVTLTIGAESASAQVRVVDPAALSADQLRAVKINMGIEDGLRALYYRQDNREANFGNSTTSWGEDTGQQANATAYTSLAVLAFENHGYQLPNSSAAPMGIYQKYAVQPGLNYLFDTLNIVTLQCGGPTEPAGDPCVGVSTDLDKGLGQSWMSPQGYSTSVAGLAVAASGAPARLVAAGLGGGASGICDWWSGCNPGNGGFVAGRSYADISQRLSNTIVWAQADDASVCGADTHRGGWRYGLDDCQSDGSAIGWAVLALLDAAAGGRTVPAFSAMELATVIANTSTANGSLLYDTGWGAGSVLRSGVRLQALFYMGVPVTDARVQDTIAYINARWNGFVDGEDFSCSSPVPVGPTAGSPNNKGCSYAMFQVFKGLKLYGISTLSNSNRADDDWHKEYEDYLIENQRSPNTTGGGEWAPNEMFWSCCDNHTVGISALSLLILAPSALILPNTLELEADDVTVIVGDMVEIRARASNRQTESQPLALAVAAAGVPVPGVTVTFEVTDGPNAGLLLQDVTDEDGVATVSYSSMDVGVDTVVARVGQLESDELMITWRVPNEPPTIDDQADITAEATGPDGAAVTFTVMGNDPEDGPLTAVCTPASGSTFPLGSTLVTCTVTDLAPSPLTATDTFNVIVQDTTPPALTLPANISEHATSPNGKVIVYAASATDLVDGVVPVTCAPPSGSTFPIGTTTVNCSAADSRKNPVNGSFLVTVWNNPPQCEVPASMPLLWPANHSMHPVAINATDPDGDPVTLTATSIRQDEPTNARGSGNTPIDGAGVGTASASVRAERVGGGDGRVYHVAFSANDGLGGVCTGVVKVGVPHDQGRGAVPVDGGPLYDSVTGAP